MRGVRYKPHEKRRALKMWLEEKVDMFVVAKRFRVTERTLWLWKSKYDGTLESLANKSSRPHTPHPNSHTSDELKHIKDIFKRHPKISYTEALGILRVKYSYSRTYGGFYNFVIKSNIRPSKEIKQYIPQEYETPEMLGKKWQMDVKFVPKECNKGDNEKYYQYTIIDEATRERFLFPYVEHSGYSTYDFVKRAICYFGYLPEIIQTDNGTEFTNPKHTNEGKVHILDKLLDQLKIKHQLIRAYTPRHNGKVERSHRSDQESFYNTLTFKTFEELKKKMCHWNKRYNNRPHTSLRNREGKRVWLTPLQKRAQLEEDLLLYKNEYRLRKIKNKQKIEKLYA